MEHINMSYSQYKDEHKPILFPDHWEFHAKAARVYLPEDDELIYGWKAMDELPTEADADEDGAIIAVYKGNKWGDPTWEHWTFVADKPNEWMKWMPTNNL